MRTAGAPSGEIRRDDQVGSSHLAARRGQSSQDQRELSERRIGDHHKRAIRQPEVGEVSFDDRAVESLAKLARSSRMQLNGDHPSASLDQMARDRAAAGAEVHHQIAWIDAGVGDQPAGFTIA
jgi:hypothetical protein